MKKEEPNYKELYERLRFMIRTAYPEKSGMYFICGEGGDKGKDGLPEKIMVCPAAGLDGFVVYQKTDISCWPQW